MNLGSDLLSTSADKNTKKSFVFMAPLNLQLIIHRFQTVIEHILLFSFWYFSYLWAFLLKCLLRDCILVSNSSVFVHLCWLQPAGTSQYSNDTDIVQENVLRLWFYTLKGAPLDRVDSGGRTSEGSIKHCPWVCKKFLLTQNKHVQTHREQHLVQMAL